MADRQHAAHTRDLLRAWVLPYIPRVKKGIEVSFWKWYKKPISARNFLELVSARRGIRWVLRASSRSAGLAECLPFTLQQKGPIKFNKNQGSCATPKTTTTDITIYKPTLQTHRFSYIS